MKLNQLISNASQSPRTVVSRLVHTVLILTHQEPYTCVLMFPSDKNLLSSVDRPELRYTLILGDVLPPAMDFKLLHYQLSSFPVTRLDVLPSAFI